MTFAVKLNPSFLTPYKEAIPPWGPVGYVTFKRTYSRRKADGRSESWFDSILRAVEGVAKYGAFTNDELETLFHYWFMLKCSGGGRHIWQLGTPAVDRIGADSLQNCWFVTAGSIREFVFAMDQLMLGGGVGMSVKAEHVYKLPPVKFNPHVERVQSFDCDYVVPDNREGWCDLLSRVLTAFFVDGRRLTYSTRCLRERGQPIRTFGGTASGGEVLVEGITLICKILSAAYGRQLVDTEAMDIFNIIGMIVVAGNVRRSSEIIIGDANSSRFLAAKKWQLGNVPSWRSNSNNSVECATFSELPEAFWDNYNGEGEPVGLVNLKNFRRFGRIADGVNYRPDWKIEGTNPCSEIGLEPFEPCNLSELFLPNLSDAEFHTSAEMMCKVNKTISCIPHAQPETREVVERNHRIGIGVTGFLQAPDKHRPTLFSSVYRHIEDTDRKYSKLLGVKPSIKLTTVKPSGTLSLLAGVTPGMHPAFGRHYIRRITFAAEDELVQLAKKNGFWIEPKLNLDGSNDLRSMIVEFPCKTPAGTDLQNEVTAIQQLEHLKFMQTYWADNSVSCTVHYSEYELPGIRNWLSKNYDDNVKSVSFLLRGSASGFKQLPYEEITEQEYNEMSANSKQIVDGVETDGTMSNDECVGGACPIR